MNMFLLSSEEWDTVRNEANQAIHELVFLSQFCEAAVDGIGDEEQIRDSIEAIEACLSEIQVCCKLASCTSTVSSAGKAADAMSNRGVAQKSRAFLN